MTITDVCAQTVEAVTQTQTVEAVTQTAKKEQQKSPIIIPQGTACYKRSGVAMRREIDKKGNRTGRYLCLSCYGHFLCIRNR